MKRAPRASNRNRSSESGQATITMVIALGTFLLGTMGFATDFANLWFHKQKAQAAADSACQAAAMDLLTISQGTSTATSAGFTPGTNFNCSATSGAAPCKYAALNSYAAPGLTAGTESNEVAVSFPASIPGVVAPPTSLAGSYPFLRVDVTDRVRVFLSGLITRSSTQDVRATAKCGLVLATAPVPILVLNPTITNALSVQGTPTINITGGPSLSIEVNSKDSAAINVGGSATIDLSKGGPAGNGSNLGVQGGPATAPGGFISGTPTSSFWNSPHAPVSDPFAQLAAPSTTGLIARSGPIATPAHNVSGCPDTAGCDEYAPGLYASVLSVKNKTAVFDPGIYYLQAGLALDSNSIVRPSTVTGSGDGTMFYLSGSSSVSVTSDSGKVAVDAFDTSRVKCPSGSAVTIKDSSGNVISSIGGNILLGMCTGTYGDPLGLNRGMLFFQDHSSSLGNKNQPNWGGGGQFILAGNMYFHNTTDFSDIFSLQGNSGSGTYVLGDIVTDQLALGGTSGIMMQLNPTAAYSILKVQLLQ